MAETTYNPVGSYNPNIYPTLPPPSHHPQYIYATPHPSQIASYPSPGSTFSHLYPSHPASTGAPQLLQVSPWGMLSTADDYEAYLAGALHTQPHYNQGHQPQRPHRDATDELDSAVGSQRKSRRQSHHQQQKPHYGQHNHQQYLYHPPYNYTYQQAQKRQRSKSSDKRYKKSSSGGKEGQRKSGPSDSDLDRTYTGLDRELAEEFIEQTMDPSSGSQQVSSSVIVHEERRRPSSKSGGSSHGERSPTRISGKQGAPVMLRPPTSAGDDETQEESEDIAW